MGTIDKRPVAAAAAAQALIVAGINLAASFGWVTLTSDQLANLNGFLALALPAILGFLIRNKIVAVADLEWVDEPVATDRRALDEIVHEDEAAKS